MGTSIEEIFARPVVLLDEIASASINSAEELEQFRIRFLGTKNILKPLFGEMRNIPNERKKEYGQVLNEVKTAAETKFNDAQSGFNKREDKEG